MNNRVNYTLIGFFVLLGISLIAMFGYWLLKPTKEMEMQTYAIYFDESVLGLNLDAPVKYRGISVGKVTRLSINPNNSEQVEVLITVLKSTPIKATTVAQLTSQGITGLSYINLSHTSESELPIKTQENQKYPVITAIPSLLIQLENNFAEISMTLSETLKRTGELLKEENRQSASKLLNESTVFMAKLNDTLDDETVRNFHKSMENLSVLSSKMEEMMPRIEVLMSKSEKWEDDIASSFISISGSYKEIAHSMNTFKKAVENKEISVKDTAADILPAVEGTLLQMQDFMLRAQEILKRYDRSPGDMLFMQEELKKGPGEN